MHDNNNKGGDSSSSNLKHNTTDELLCKLLNKLGVSDSSNDTMSNKGASSTSQQSVKPVAYHTQTGPGYFTSQMGPTGLPYIPT